MAPLPDAVGLVARSELRARWKALVGLALLVGLVGAVALSAVAGQRRTSSALDRFLEATEARDVRVNVVDQAEADKLLAALADEPWVEDVAHVAALVFNPGGGEIFTVFASPDESYQATIDRPLVVDGRLPRSGSTDEIAVDEAMADQMDLAPGDEITVRLIDPELLECVLAGTCAPDPAELLDGEELTLTVTGIGRDVDAFNGSLVTGEASAPQSFFEQWGGATGAFPPSIEIRLQNGADDLDRLQDLVEEEGIRGLVLEADEDFLESPSDAIDVQASSLLVFAVVTGLAGAVAAAQAVSRQMGATGNRSDILADLGMTRRSRAAALALPVLAAAVAGAVLAVALALLVSDRFPFAEVRRIEPDPGRRFDPATLLLGGAVLVVLVAGAAFWSAWRRASPTHDPAIHRASPVATWAERTGAPPAIVAGTRLAVSGGPSRTTISLRSAMVGALLGVAGVVAAGVFASSLDTLVDSPDRWGFDWSVTGTPLDPTGVETQVVQIGAEDDIDGAAIYRVGAAVAEGEDVTAHALQLPQGRVGSTILEGRPPDTEDEVALGERTQEELGVAIGDSVTFTDADDAEHDLEVVGTAAFPTFQERVPGEGVLLTFEGWDRVNRSEGTSEYVLVYDPDADADELEQRLLTEYQVGVRPPPLPSRLANLDDGSEIFGALLAFFAALGLVGLLHALVSSVRRRQHLFATWRALGFTPGQVRRSVLWQGEVITFVGVVVGVPVGIVAGRLTWLWVIGDVGVIDDPATPIVLLLVVVPVALLVALLIGAGPAWLAGRGPAAAGLRTE